MIRAIVFDLDGVIIQSEQGTFDLLKQIVRSYNLDLHDSLYKKRVGKKIREFVHDTYKNTIPAAEREKIIDAFYTEYKANTEKYISPILRTIEFIKNHKGTLKLGLSSVSSAEEIQKILNALGIYNRFDCIISSDDITKLKPDPEIYVKAAKQLDIPAQECAAIEDSVIGIEAANLAGFQSYVFLNGVNKRNEFNGIKFVGFIQTENDLVKLVSS